MSSQAIQSHEYSGGYIGRIPVRNLWLLMFYASDLFKHQGAGKIALEDAPDDIPDLVAEILIRIVEKRLMHNLSFGYRTKQADLSRVRGRIDHFRTERQQLLLRGRVACQFEELTVNTPRNRYVRAALNVLSGLVNRPVLMHKCRALAGNLFQMGVTGEKPSRAQVSIDRFGRHDSDDQQMVAAAHLAFELALPTEQSGTSHLTQPEKEITWLRRLFEKAVAGFYDVVLSADGWRVSAGKKISWQITEKTEGIDRILPSMVTDIQLEHQSTSQRVIIDTKFNAIVTSGWYREETLRSGYLYQIYTYLRSQEQSCDPLSLSASGMLLHPSIEKLVDESVVIQGHQIRFATVDLSKSTNEIRERLLQIVRRDDQFLVLAG
ncbi:5-methylcytosine-specific restriction endonuclease system specificity protein McrC [Methylotuvimicrobium sp. KM1]|uniref:5-methylcytosine-specific restriction endonuclease system specificity protein McrC n=1 Tax=Methylotuvimicrobium sp. KM1 TaxID=3377707 RepID=UPI00384F0882